MAVQADTTHLNPIFGNRLNGLINEVNAAGGHVVVTSGFRTAADQKRLIDNPALHAGRPVAAVGTSLHEKGLAADLDGDPKTMQLVSQLAPRYGITGLDGDPGHYQLAGAKSDGSVDPAGLDAATGTAPTTTANGGEPMPLLDRFQAVMDLINGTSSTPEAGATTAPAAQTPTTTTTPTVTPTGMTQAGTGKYATLINASSQKYSVDPRLVQAVMMNESGGNATAGSGAGAQGLMQLMPDTAKGLGVTNALDPAQNIDGGTKMLSQLLKKYKGNTELALAAYNAGPGAVDSHGGIPPFPETQNYVKNVMGQYKAMTNG